MAEILFENEDGKFEEVTQLTKDIWYRVEGEDEKQNTHVILSEFEAKHMHPENVAYKCVNHLQFESKRWSELDFSRYPLKVIFGYTCEVNGNMNNRSSYVFEGFATSTPRYDGDGLIMIEDEVHHKDYVEPSDELLARAEEHGWIWCPDEEAFEDEFYRSMDVEGYGGSVYLSDGVSISRTTIPLEDMEKLLDEWDEIDLAELAKGK